MTDEPEIAELRPDEAETMMPTEASEACAVDAAAPNRAAAPRDLPRLMTRIFGTPLLIDQGKMAVILAALGPRLNLLVGGATVLSAKASADLAALQPESLKPGALIPIDDDECVDTGKPYTLTPDGIAVIALDGTLVYKSSWLGALSGLTSYAEVKGALDAAVENPSVKGILLLVDSYGGEANGCFDLSDAVFAARQQKPVYGCAADDAMSGAYAQLAATSKVFVSRTSGVASIGVVVCHVDQSGADKMEGLKYTYIISGARKADLNPHEPPSTPALEAMQGEVDRLRGLFAASVAKYRGISIDDVMGTEASIYYGETAIAAHLADAVGTPGDALAALRAEIASREAKGSAPMSSAPGERVVDFAAARETLRADLIAEHGEIIELCTLAGRPDMAADFVRSRKSLADVRKLLQDQRADASDARRTSGHIMPDADGNNPQANAAGWDTALAKARGQKGTK